jgi:hypothetical protein
MLLRFFYTRAIAINAGNGCVRVRLRTRTRTACFWHTADRMNVRSVVFVAGILCAASAHASDYVLDPVHTQVFACASHIGFSTPCARFKIKSGFFHFDDAHWSTATVDATVDTTSIDLGDREVGFRRAFVGIPRIGQISRCAFRFRIGGKVTTSRALSTAS